MVCVWKMNSLHIQKSSPNHPGSYQHCPSVLLAHQKLLVLKMPNWGWARSIHLQMGDSAAQADKLPHPFNKKVSFCKCRDRICLFPPLLAAWALHNRLTDMAGLPGQLRGSCTLLHFGAVQAFTRANQTPPLLYAWAAVFAQPLILG